MASDQTPPSYAVLRQAYLFSGRLLTLIEHSQEMWLGTVPVEGGGASKRRGQTADEGGNIGWTDHTKGRCMCVRTVHVDCYVNLFNEST